MERVNVAILLGLTMCSGGSWAQEAFATDWTDGLLDQIRRINENVQRNVQSINENVQRNVQSINENVQRNVQSINENVQRNVQSINENVQRNVQSIDRRIQEQVRANQAGGDGSGTGYAELRTTSLIVNGDTIVVDTSGGTSRSVYSGRTPNGEPYFRDIEERIVGDTLYRTDRYYDPRTKTTKEERYRLDLTDPAAKPVPIPTFGPVD